MKIPLSPPDFSQLLESNASDLAKIGMETFVSHFEGKYRDGYLHWDKLRHLTPPEGLNHEQWWLRIKLGRAQQYRRLPMADKNGNPFVYSVPDDVMERLHHIDSRASGRITFSENVATKENRDRFIFNSLVEEAITSSQLEGASTTRQIAADMLRTSRNPRNKSEQMILNNYLAMRQVREICDKPLTEKVLMKLHTVLTIDTLEDPTAAGRLQRPDEERVHVMDNASQKTLHEPPPAEQLSVRIKQMIRFANGETETAGFLHPLLRAIILHFWVGYDHPFLDGNGRTARALFYWSVLRDQYWMFEFISISRILKQAPAQYSRAYLYSETDANDLTYFIIHQLEVIEKALNDLDEYLQRKTEQVQQIEKILHHTKLNNRQIALLSHAARHPGHEYVIKSHQTSHRIAYGTARSDLMELAEIGILRQKRIGLKTLTFIAPENIEDKIKQL